MSHSNPSSSLPAEVLYHQRGSTGGGRDGMLAFMHAKLFDPLGMRSAVPEFDKAGNFLGGAFVWASARDWARFGLLFLRDGVWEGARVLPAGWVDYVRTPAPAPADDRSDRARGARAGCGLRPLPSRAAGGHRRWLRREAGMLVHLRRRPRRGRLPARSGARIRAGELEAAG